MKVLIAPDKFKGSLSAAAAAQAIARGFRAVLPDIVCDIVPIADGGDGFAEALCVALNGEWVETTVRDPLGRPVTGRYLWIDDKKIAVVEMSEASGLWRVASEERAPMRATTFGTGQLMRDATARGARTIIVGLGGSATTDGGLGMAEALGYEFVSADERRLEAIPENFHSIARIDATHSIPLPEIIAACDVENPLLGPRGTAHVFSPQKGASPEEVSELERRLKHVSAVVHDEFGSDHANTAGAGAAGGLGFGLLVFCKARICSGFDVVAHAVQLEQRIAECDLVVTGEGSLDAQTLEGKGPAGLCALARKCGKPTLAFAGSIRDHQRVDALFAATCGIVDEPLTLQEAMQRGGELLQRAAERAARLLRLGRES